MTRNTAGRSALQAGRKAMDIGVATPQVVAHRLTRMACAGPHLSARDQKEFMNMVLEKQLAFSQSWWAACNAASHSPWSSIWSSWNQALTGGMLATPWHWWNLTEQTMSPAHDIWNAALTPIHQKATSNARRLARTPLFEQRKAR